jgi:hypothetical protein
MKAFTTPQQIEAYRIKVIASALRMYLDHGIKANRMYTPPAMREAATTLTGRRYVQSRRGLQEAYADLTALYNHRMLEMTGKDTNEKP